MDYINILNWKKLLQSFALAEGLNINETHLDLFEKFVIELQEWNKTTNLTSLKKIDDIVIKHLFDSIIILKHISIKNSLVDIGSGGGFPGIPLKIVRPELNILLVESKRKKTNFLNHAISSLGLKNIAVYNGRVEDYSVLESFDSAISRAFAELKHFCTVSAPLIKPGGHIIAMKGKNFQEEVKNMNLQALGLTLSNILSFDLPLEKGSRNIIVFEKCFT